MWNEEELEELKQLTNGMDSEESTDGSDITDDVNVDDVNIEFTEDEEEKTNTDERLVCEGLKTNLKDPKQSIDFKNHMDEMIAGTSSLKMLNEIAIANLSLTFINLKLSNC